MNRQKLCLYTQSVTSYTILGRPGKALRPIVTNGDVVDIEVRLVKYNWGYGMTSNDENCLILCQSRNGN